MGPTPFTLSLPFCRTAKGRIAVDGRLRVLAPRAVGPDGAARSAADAPAGPRSMRDVSLLQDESPPGVGFDPGEPVPGVFALGDCCASADHPLPALAQVAEQQGKYLAKMLNAAAGAGVEGQEKPPEPFVYRSLGSMALVGEWACMHFSCPRCPVSQSISQRRLGMVCTRDQLTQWSYLLRCCRRAGCGDRPAGGRRAAVVGGVHELDSLALRVPHATRHHEGAALRDDELDAHADVRARHQQVVKAA